MATFARTLTPAERAFLLNEDTHQPLMVEQEGFTPEVQNYLQDFSAANPTFTLDKIINRKNVIHELQRSWPRMPQHEVAENRLFNYIYQVVHTLPPAGPSSSCAVRIWVVTPQQPAVPLHLPQPDEAGVIASFNSIEGTLHRFIVPPAESLPPLSTLNIHSGLMVISQPLPPLTNQFKDYRANGIGAGNLYGDRAQDKLLTGDDPEPKDNFLQTPPLQPLPDLRKHPYVPRPPLEEEEQFVGGSRREDYSYTGAPLTHAAEAALIGSALEQHQEHLQEQRREENASKQQELLDKQQEERELREREYAERYREAQNIEAGLEAKGLPIAEASEIAGMAAETMKSEAMLTTQEDEESALPERMEGAEGPERPDTPDVPEEVAEEEAAAEGFATEKPEAPEALSTEAPEAAGGEAAARALEAQNEQRQETPEAIEPEAERTEGTPGQEAASEPNVAREEPAEASRTETPEPAGTENHIEAPSEESSARNEPAEGERVEAEPTSTGPTGYRESVEGVKEGGVVQTEQTPTPAEQMTDHIDELRKQSEEAEDQRKHTEEAIDQVTHNNEALRHAHEVGLHQQAGMDMNQHHHALTGEEAHMGHEALRGHEALHHIDVSRLHHLASSHGHMASHREMDIPREARDYRSMDRELNAIRHGAGTQLIHSMTHHLLHGAQPPSHAFIPPAQLHHHILPTQTSPLSSEKETPIAMAMPATTSFWMRNPLSGIIPYLAAGLIGKKKASQQATPTKIASREEMLRAQELEKQKKKARKLVKNVKKNATKELAAKDKDIKGTDTKPIEPEAPSTEDLTPTP